MPQAVKLPDALIEDARRAAERESRSLAGQIEHWARLGRTVDADLRNPELGSLLEPADAAVAREAVVDAIEALAADPQWRRELAARLADETTYGTDPAFPGCVVRREPSGARTPGRFAGRRFVPLELPSDVDVAGD